MNTWPYDRKTWFNLPLQLRQRWWRETYYSQIIPSCALLAAVIEALLRKAIEDDEFKFNTEEERSEEVATDDSES